MEAFDKDKNDALALAQALRGKCLIGMRGSPFLFVKIQESRNEEYTGRYGFWLYDGSSVLEPKRPLFAEALPALVRWIQMQGLHFKEPVLWRFEEVKEIKNADINI